MAIESFPELKTERLVLRKIQLSDIPQLIQQVNNQKISDQILNIPYPYGEEDAIQRINFVLQGFKNRERFVFVILHEKLQTLIGEIGIHLDTSNDKAEIGYWIAESFWGKGIASEAVNAILRFGFETLKLNKICATHYPDNPASGKVLAKNGLIKEAELKAHYKVNGIYKDIYQYGLIRQEYLSE